MKKRIIIVDDEPNIVDLLSKIFESEDCETVGFGKARDAIEFVQAHEVDVIITDVMMPGIKGDNLCTEVKKLEPTVQLVVITGYPTEALFESLFRMGISDVFVKPFEFDKLKENVLLACERSQNLKLISRPWRKTKD